MTNNLVALSSVAILSVYGIGYARTQNAADLMATQGEATAIPPGQSVTLPTATVPSAKARQSTKGAPTATAIPILSDDDQPGAGTDGQVGQAAPAVPTEPAVLGSTPVTAARQPKSTSSPPATATPAPVATSTPKPNVRTLRDGSYVGSGFSRHGDIEATVVISGGRIVSANVTSCRTRYPCRYVTPLVSEVVSSQTAPIDIISGATDSSYAYHDAVVKALSQAT